MIAEYISSILKPNETFKTEKSRATFGKTILNFVIAAILTIIAYIIFPLAISLETAVWYVLGIIPVGLWAIITTVIAKKFHGKGNTLPLFYLWSIITVPLTFLLLLAAIVSPFWMQLGFDVIGIVILVFIYLYDFYLSALAIKENYNLNTTKAIVTLIAGGIILLIVLAILIILLTVLTATLYPSNYFKPY